MTIEEIAATLNKALQAKSLKPVRMVIEPTEGSGRDVVVLKENEAFTVKIFPVIIKQTSFSAIQSILKALGSYALEISPDSIKHVWERRLVAARPEQVNAFQLKLSSGDFLQFEAIVETFERATDRLVAIHLANGLLSNGQTCTSSANVNVKEWGTTSQFANGTKPYSLVPLLSVYAPTDVYQNFGSAFADYVLAGLGSVSESSVRTEYSNLVQRVAKILS